jgi:hypothetical protein
VLNELVVRILARGAGLLSSPGKRVLYGVAAHTIGCVPGAGLLLFGKPVVAWGVWVPVVKLPEFVQSARGEVVVRLLRPISTFRVLVKPFDEVENTAVVTASSLDT